MKDDLEPIDLPNLNRIDLDKPRTHSFLFIVSCLVVVTVLFFIKCSPVNAESSFVVGGWSKHFVARNHHRYTDINEKHKAIGFMHNNWFLTGFENSFDKYGALAGKSFHQFSIGRLSYRINVGAFYGYNRKQVGILEAGLSPFLAAAGSYRVKLSKSADLSLDLSFAPTLGDFKGIAMLNLRYIPKG